ncbi:unnamed protein product [Adineta steineri]|uniref:Uncharacterized protein n=1 Tax=Adineta steineri TaxID=433720 RepID=A0A813NXF6_9BILA|nr:unnamed protein product [Adineta steineri]CAF3847861.1 unnamed protein product [Adineta steineri]
MDTNTFIYVSDYVKNEVRRWKEGDERRTIVTGGNGQGNHLNQLNYPTFIFVDEDSFLYVSDRNNNRVMKWRKNAKEGIVVVGGNDQTKELNQLHYPNGLSFDDEENLYVMILITIEY